MQLLVLDIGRYRIFLEKSEGWLCKISFSDESVDDPIHARQVEGCLLLLT